MTIRSACRLIPPALAATLTWAELSLAQPGTLEWRIRTGTDLIGEQFHLIEDDTLDLTTDVRAQLQTRWTYGGSESASKWRDVDLDHRVGIGTEALRHDFSGRAVWNPDQVWRADLRGVTLARYYLDDPGGARSNFVQGRFQATLERDLFDGNSSWGIDQGVEGTAYGTRSPVFLNGLRHWHGFVADVRRAFDFTGGRIAVEHERIPDSTALDYLGIAGDAYASWLPSLAWDLSADASFIGRRYRQPEVRPHQTTLTAHMRVGWRFLNDWSVEASPGLTLASYSPADSIYYNYRRINPTLNLIWWPVWGSVRAGPTAQWQRSPTFRGEDYDQWGLVAGLNLSSLDWGFFDLTSEVGWRNYRHDEESSFSDCRYWDTTLLLTGRLPWNLQLDAFLIFRVEGHSDVLDNTRSLLLTVDLSRALNR